MRLVISTVLLSLAAMVSCGNGGLVQVPFSPGFSFSPSGSVTVEASAEAVAVPYRVTVSRVAAFDENVEITLGVDAALVPESKEAMSAGCYSLPPTVTIPSGEASATFTVTLDPKALYEEKGGDFADCVLPVTMTSTSPKYNFDKAKTSVIIALDIDTAAPTVTVDAGQSFALTFGDNDDEAQTVNLSSTASAEFDFTKLSYNVATGGVDEYNEATGDERTLLPGSAYSFGTYSYTQSTKKLTHPLTVDRTSLSAGEYILPLRMVSSEAGVTVVQQELCFVAVNVVEGAVGVIVNGDFSTAVDVSHNYGAGGGIAGEWRYTGGWNPGGATVTYSSTEGVGGSPCIVIATRTGSSTDVMVSQKVTGLNSEKAYKVTAQIKTQGITKGRGANIAEGPDLAPASDGITGTKGWTTETLSVPDPVGGEVLISLRLGYNSSDSDGKAWFDNVEISEDNDIYIRQSTHVKLMIPKNRVPAAVSDADMDVWLANLDRAYLAYKVLFSGRAPWGGIRMKIRAAAMPYWALAGNPIQWNPNYISSELTSIKNNSDWSFGILHEIAHNFNTGGADKQIGKGNQSWNWDEEVFANFRMAYILQNVTGSRVRQRNTNYGENIITYYKLAYDDTIGKNAAANGDAIQYTLLRIVGEYGWEPVIEAFDYLYELAPGSPSGSNGWSKWQKFNFFLDTLNDYVPSGQDVRSTYTANELSLIQSGLTQ